MTPVPKAPLIPLSYSIPRVIKLARNPVKMFSRYTKRFGSTFTLHVGGSRKSVVSIEPDFAQQVLQKNHRNYRKSEIQTDQLADFIGRGLLTNDGEDWLRQRRLIQPGFHRDRLASVVDLMNKVVIQRGDALAQKLKKEDSIDMYPFMMQTAFHIIARTIFSTSMEEDRLLYLSDNITKLQHYIVYSVRLPFLRPFLKISGQKRAMFKRREESFAVLNNVIEQRKQSGETIDDLLQMLLDSRYEDTGAPMEARRLLEETVVLFVAGHETSANALSWIFYLLSRHPEVVEQLRAELDEKLGSNVPDLANLRQLTYLTQVINEAMRLYPPAWITDRLAIGEDEAAGYYIPPETIVMPFIYGLHHNPEYWPDPDRFDPDRFSAENRKAQHPFAFLPFGGGPRLCIGNNFAILEMQLVIAHFLQRFDFKPADDRPVDAFPLVTLRPKPGVFLKMQSR